MEINEYISSLKMARSCDIHLSIRVLKKKKDKIFP